MTNSARILLILALTTTAAFAAERPRVADIAPHALVPAAPTAAKAAGDTVYVIGGPDRDDGKFQDDADRLLPDAEGWATPFAMEPDPYWSISSFNAATLDPVPAENLAMWCGDDFPDCSGEPLNPGYGNGWDELLVWSGAVADPGLATQVRVTARLNHDTEPGYDYVQLEAELAGGWTEIAGWTGANKSGGVFTPVDVDVTVSVAPADYRGAGADEVRLRWRVLTDGAFSDADCLWPTDGAAQLDNIAVSFDQGGGAVQQTYDDFQPGSPVHWTGERSGCGVAAVRGGLDDFGSCRPDVTPQLAFVDDGSACGSAGTPGVDWTYGPDGFVHPCDRTVDHREFWSPPLTLPDMSTRDGARLEFDAYLHQTNTAGPMVIWALRFSEDGGFTWGLWRNLGVVYESRDPQRRRYAFEVGTLIPPTADMVQISLGTYVFPSFGDLDCDRITPAPYYDNVALKVFTREGPMLGHHYSGWGRPAQSMYPEAGAVDVVDLAANSVRFDNAPSYDVIEFNAAPRVGATLGAAEIHWALDANPLFDPYRTNTPPNPAPGWSAGPISQPDGYDDVEEFHWDLPDSGFLFPGDVLHYHLKIHDDLAGDVASTTLPVDLTGFGDFTPGAAGPEPAWPARFTVRALPDLRAAHADSVPHILVIDESPQPGDAGLLLRSLVELGFVEGVDFDMLVASGFSIPLNDLLTPALLDPYETILYTTGRIDGTSLSTDESGLLETWIATGGRNLLVMGENTVLKMHDGFFAADYLGTTSSYDMLRDHIDDQAMPDVKPAPGNSLGLTTSFIADGCDYELFSPLALYGTGEAVLEYLTPDGTAGVYDRYAGVAQHLPARDFHALTLGLAFADVGTPFEHPDGPAAARTVLLGEILTFFGHGASGPTTGVSTPDALAVRAWPNPFNPRLSIAWNLPREGRLEVAIYNLRGERVTRLVDDVLPAGPGSTVWNGTDDAGRAAAAGAYVAVMSHDGERRLRKVALIR